MIVKLNRSSGKFKFFVIPFPQSNNTFVLSDFIKYPGHAFFFLGYGDTHPKIFNFIIILLSLIQVFLFVLFFRTFFFLQLNLHILKYLYLN